MPILKNANEVSKRIKQDLKENFPNIKFSVKRRSGSGSAITVSWNFGPTPDEVESIIKRYEIGYFDGMEDLYHYRPTMVDLPEGGQEELGGVKYIFTQRDYKTVAEQNSVDHYTEFYKPETSFEYLLAKDIAKSNGQEWKGYDTNYFGENNHEFSALNIARRVLDNNSFDTDTVNSYQGLVKTEKARIDVSPAVYNTETNRFEYNGENFWPHAVEQGFVVLYDDKQSTPAGAIKEIKSRVENIDHLKAEAAARENAAEQLNIQKSQLNHVINGSQFSDSVRQLAKITLYEVDRDEAEKDVKNLQFKRFELKEPVILPTRFPGMDNFNSLNEALEYADKYRSDDKFWHDQPTKIEQVIMVDTVNYAILANSLTVALPEVWKNIGGRGVDDAILQKEFGFDKGQINDFGKRLGFWSLTPAEQAVWHQHAYTIASLVYNEETKESFLARAGGGNHVQYAGYLNNPEDAQKAIEAIKLKIVEKPSPTLLDLNLTPSEFYSRLDLTKMDPATAEKANAIKNPELFKYIDDEPLAPQIKLLSEFIYMTYPEALGIPPEVDTEELAQKAAEEQKQRAAEKINKLTARLGLVKKMASANPKNTKLQARIKLIQKMLDAASAGPNQKAGGGKMDGDLIKECTKIIPIEFTATQKTNILEIIKQLGNYLKGPATAFTSGGGFAHLAIKDNNGYWITFNNTEGHITKSTIPIATEDEFMDIWWGEDPDQANALYIETDNFSNPAQLAEKIKSNNFKSFQMASGGMYATKEKFTSLAPEGTVFVKINSHRASDKVRRAGNIAHTTFYNFYVGGTAGQDVWLINKKDFNKIKDITGVTGPYEKLTSPGMKWAARWPSKGTEADQKLATAYDQLNKPELLKNGGPFTLDADRAGAANIKAQIEQFVGAMADKVTYIGNNTFEILFNENVNLNELGDILRIIDDITLDGKTLKIWATTGITGNKITELGQVPVTVKYTIDDKMEKGGSCGCDHTLATGGHPPAEAGKETGLYKGPSHASGGIDVVVDGVKPVEVEGDEYYLCADAWNDAHVFEFTDKTPKQMLDAIFKHAGCNFEQNKANSDDFVVCKKVVHDENKYSLTGTCKEIVNKLQADKRCETSNN